MEYSSILGGHCRKKKARGLKILEFQGVPIEEIANGISKGD